MAFQKKTMIKWAVTTLWVLVGAGVIVLLVAAIKMKNSELCKGLNINIRGVNNVLFVDKNDITNTITDNVGGSPVGMPVREFELKKLEAEIMKDVWVKKARMFFDNNEVLQVNVDEREPLARVFTTGNTTFYIDSAIMMLPLSQKFSARLPVFTGFPSDKMVLAKEDSALLKSVLKLSIAIQKDSFAMAMIDQVDIRTDRTFELVPKLGNSTIEFGDATDLQEKLYKFKLFYVNVISKSAWDKYSVISLQYKHQVVARRKGTEDIKADSLQTKELLKQFAERAEKMANDSVLTIVPDNEHNTTDENFIQHSFERDDNAPNSYTSEKPEPQGAIPVLKPKPVAPVVVPVTKPPVTQPVHATAPKPISHATVPKPAVVNKPAKVPVVNHSGNKPAQAAVSPPKPSHVQTKPNNDY